MPGKYRFSIATFAVLFLASFFILIGGLIALTEWFTRNDWIETEAKVIATRMQREARSGRGPSHVDVRWATVRFSLPDGRVVTASLRNDAPPQATIWILYNRNQPKEVRRADLPGEFVAALFMLALGALCLVVAHFVALRGGAIQRGP